MKTLKRKALATGFALTPLEATDAWRVPRSAPSRDFCFTGEDSRMRRFIAAILTNLCALLATLSAADAREDFTPAIGIAVNSDREAYFGDLHLHTRYSFDAYINRGAQAEPEEAYRFARGEPGTFLGRKMTRVTPPLDFMAVTDHAEWLGVIDTLEDPDSELSKSELAKGLRDRDPDAFSKLGRWDSPVKPIAGIDMKKLSQSAWQRTIEAANRNYRPGRFTTFIGYEWTASSAGRTLHRNVIFRGNHAPAPFTAVDSARPEDLWAYLEAIRKQGHEALAIPHNSNMSDGLMFGPGNSEGSPIDQAYAVLRSSNEPLVEISQTKGQSEAHPALSPNDEFSNIEIYEYFGSKKSNPAGSYVRDSLGRGMEVAQRTGGGNPFKYGFAGGSDIHNGLSDSAEQTYAGAIVGGVDPAILPLFDRWLERTWLERNRMAQGKAQKSDLDVLDSASGSLTGVWAEQNTREAIYAALRRKETFATSGTRLRIRFFGGWAFGRTLLESRDWVKAAYAKGVPMGEDLRPLSGARKPQFVAWAVKDPNGANLDRIQIVKIWVKDGESAEKVYDVALSDGRTVDPRTGKAPPVGNTVDVRTATYKNSIGAAELGAVWEDPQFDAMVPAVYYVRVLEIPTPRWSTIVAVRRGELPPDAVPTTTQERGWASPIWYDALALTGKDRVRRERKNSRD